MTVQPTRDQLRALANAATEGPWNPHPAGKYVWTEDLGGIIQNWSDDANAAADMEFIAAARTTVPALLDALDQAEATIRRQERYIEGLESADAVGLKARAQRAEARIQAVRELHSESRIITGTPVFGCAECGEPNETEPCATIQALDGER